MGFLNVYNNFRNFNAHISHAFKVTFFDNIPENGNILLSTCVKSITKPVFKLDTEKYNYNFGNSRFVIPIIDFSSARMSVTFYEEDNMAVQAALTGYLGNLGGFVPEVNILLEEFTNDMLYIISSKVYRARLIELSLPGFNNEGEGSIQEITAEFNVTRIYDSLKEFETSIQNYKTEKTYTYEYNTVDSNGNIVNTFSINNINKAAKKPSSVKLTNKTFTQELYIELLNKRKRLLDAKAGIESAKTNNEEDLQDGEEFLNSLKANLPTNDESKRKYYETILNSVILEDGKYKVNIAMHGAVAGNYTDGGVIKEYDSIDDLYAALNDTSFNKASGIPGMPGYNENQDGVKHTGINLKISMEDLKELIVYNSEAREIGNATNEIEKLDGELAAIERRLGDLAHDIDVKQLSTTEVADAAGDYGVPPPSPIEYITSDGSSNGDSSNPANGEQGAAAIPCRTNKAGKKLETAKNLCEFNAEGGGKKSGVGTGMGNAQWKAEQGLLHVGDKSNDGGTTLESYKGNDGKYKYKLVGKNFDKIFAKDDAMSAIDEMVAQGFVYGPGYANGNTGSKLIKTSSGWENKTYQDNRVFDPNHPQIDCSGTSSVLFNVEGLKLKVNDGATGVPKDEIWSAGNIQWSTNNLWRNRGKWSLVADPNSGKTNKQIRGVWITGHDDDDHGPGHIVTEIEVNGESWIVESSGSGGANGGITKTKKADWIKKHNKNNKYMFVAVT